MQSCSYVAAVHGCRRAIRRTLADRSTEGWFRSWSDISLSRPWASFCSFLCCMPCGVGEAEAGRQSTIKYLPDASGAANVSSSVVLRSSHEASRQGPGLDLAQQASRGRPTWRWHDTRRRTAVYRQQSRFPHATGSLTPPEPNDTKSRTACAWLPHPAACRYLPCMLQNPNAAPLHVRRGCSGRGRAFGGHKCMGLHIFAAWQCSG